MQRFILAEILIRISSGQSSEK